MSSFTIHPRWRAPLRTGALVAAVAIVAGAPLTARAEWEHHAWRGHEWRENHEWREHYHPYAYGYATPRYYYAPNYGSGYAYAPSYGYGYAYPGPSLSFSFRN